MTQHQDYYVYYHIRPDNNTIFYVGRGRRRRAWNTNDRCQEWHDVVNANGCDFIVEFVKKDMDIFSANDLEISEIARLGRACFGTGLLVNRTGGGSGTRYKSPAAIEALRLSKLGKKRKTTPEGLASFRELRKKMDYSYLRDPAGIEKRRQSLMGHVLSEETKRKIGLSNKGNVRPDYVLKALSIKNSGGGNPAAKKVLNTKTGEIYSCCKEAAKANGINYTHLSCVLAGSLKNVTSLVYI